MSLVSQSVLFLLISKHNIYCSLNSDVSDMLSQILTTMCKMGIVLQVKLRPSTLKGLRQGCTPSDRIKIHT